MKNQHRPLKLVQKIYKFVGMKISIILVYVDAKTNEIINKLKGRKNFNKKTYKIMAKNQLPSVYKKKRCNFVIRNNFKKEFVIKQLNELKVKLGI